MESSVVSSWANMNCEIVVRFFEKNFPQFQIVSQYAYSPYWEITIGYIYIKIKVGGDIGFSIDILLDETIYPLWQYDRSVNDKLDTSKENIIYQLNVLKRFLNEVGY